MSSAGNDVEKPVIRVAFVDFWRRFQPENDVLYHALAARFEVVIDTVRPDYLFFSCFGRAHIHPRYEKTVKIFFTGENLVPDFNDCDYGIGFQEITFGERYLRFSPFAANDTALVLDEPAVDPDARANREKFCNFIFSNRDADPIRDRFFQTLSARKPVDSLGRHLNNSSDLQDYRSPASRSQQKIEVQSRYRFSIAFENSTAPGYTTEKIADALAAGTVPIYWGNPLIGKEFNPARIINAHDFADLDTLCDHVLEVDADRARLRDIAAAPVFLPEQKTIQDNRADLEQFLADIVAQGPVDARRLPDYGRGAILRRKKRRLFRRP